MAESKRVYEIRINGIQESYEGVKSLREALSGLTDTVINVSNEEKKTSETRKSTASSTDALAKAQQKLNEYDRAYQEELAKVNAELSANKKEINDALKLQQAQDVVDAKQLDTYAQKQQYLSALNTLIRNHSTATEEDTQAIDRMVQESAQLQAELKATDEQMQIYVRNVGNYQGAADTMIESHKGIKQELKDIKGEMAEMLANGVSKTDEGYLKLAERAGQLKDALGDANQDIANFASDTRGLSNAINLASSAVNAYQLYNSTMELFGAGNEEAAESMKKMMAVMTVLNSLQQVQNSLLENGSATARLYHKGVELIQAALGLKKTAVEADTAATEANAAANEANIVSQEANAAANEASAVAEGVETAAKEANTVATGTNSGALGTNTGALGANAAASQGAATATNTMSVAQKAGAVASKTLSVALRAIPLMAIIGLVMALIQNWQSIWNWFKKTFPILDTLSKKFNKLGGWMNAIVTGAKAVGAAVLNWLINPWKTFANVIGKILEGDFAGAWQAALDGVKNQFKGTMDAFNNEVVKGYARGQEQMTQKNAEENVKRWEHDLKMMKKKKNADGTYTKEYLDMQDKIFQEKKKMYKKDSDEYRKVEEEEVAFHEQSEEKKTKASEKAAKARAAAAKKASAEAKKATDEARKAAEEFEKARKKLNDETEKAIESGEKLADATTKKMLKVNDDILKSEQKNNAKRAQLVDEQIAIAERAKVIVTEKIKEVQGILKDVSETATSSEKELLAGFIGDLVSRQTYLNDFVKSSTATWRNYVEEVGKALHKRKEIAINQLALEAIETKKTYDKSIEDLDAYIKQLKKRKEKENKEQQAETDKLIARAEQAKEDAKKAREDELGAYAKNYNIYIPVNLDLDNVYNRFDTLQNDLIAKGKSLDFTFNDVIGTLLGMDGVLDDLYKKAAEGGEDKLVETFRDLGTVLGMATGQTEDHLNELQNFLDVVTDPRPYNEKAAELSEYLTKCSIDVSKFGSYSKQAADLMKQVTDDTIKMFDDEYKAFVSQQDKVISYNEKVIKNFQEAAKGVKLEPVMQDDALSGILKGQIIDLDKTRDRYADLKKSYDEYQKSVKKGSDEMNAYEEAWQKKLTATATHVDLLGEMYGKESQEYKNALMEYNLLVDEKKKTDAAYAMEYEKVTQQIEDISKKQADLMYDYIESIANRFASITKTIQDNVMNPIFDGLSDLFAFQLEEAEDALDEITELYDKAVEAREQSADRMKEINEELRADDGQNKEALQQRLAEEEVLLVQREEAERALEKEKKKREYEVQVAEAKQRKFELGQKLIEGLVNTALGVTAALKYGPIMGPIFAAIIGAMGALQTAIISKQIGNVKMPQKYAAGGKVGEDGVSRSHKQGGHRIEGTNIEVEGGEWVINKASSKKYDSLLKSINDDSVGLVRKQIEIIKEKRIVERPNRIALMADGGQINTLAATRAVKENNEIAAISELIKQIDFQPTVSVVDINKVSKRLVRVQDLSGKAV